MGILICKIFRWPTILLAFLWFAATLSTSSCSSEDTDFTTQNDKIVSFLESRHTPTLISSGLAQSSVDNQVEFYTKFINSSYRYIRNYYDSSRDGRREVKGNSKIKITFWVYNFSLYSQPNELTTMPLYTNDPSLEEALEKEGLNTEYWDFTPRLINLSEEDSIIIGANKALIGCKEGDFVEIYMTYNTAYDNNIIGVVERYTPIAMFCQIETVE